LKEVEKEHAIEREHKTATEILWLEEAMKIMEEHLKKNKVVNFQQMMSEARRRARTKSDS
jgi:hypothetical protein